MASKQLPAMLIPGQRCEPGSDVVHSFSTRSQWFACAHLSNPYLTGSRSRLFPDAHHHGFCPQQLRVVWSLRLHSGSGGPTSISGTAGTPTVLRDASRVGRGNYTRGLSQIRT